MTYSKATEQYKKVCFSYYLNFNLSKGENDIAVGNVIGSNILNIFNDKVMKSIDATRS